MPRIYYVRRSSSLWWMKNKTNIICALWALKYIKLNYHGHVMFVEYYFMNAIYIYIYVYILTSRMTYIVTRYIYYLLILTTTVEHKNKNKIKCFIWEIENKYKIKFYFLFSLTRESILVCINCWWGIEPIPSGNNWDMKE